MGMTHYTLYSLMSNDEDYDASTKIEKNFSVVSMHALHNVSAGKNCNRQQILRMQAIHIDEILT